MIRIDDVERLVKAHNDMVGALMPFRDNAGSINYQVTDSVKAAQDIARAISGTLSSEGRIA